jgi:hypothetical protein
LPDAAAGRLAALVAGCLLLSALSLVLPWALAFDPWAWAVWGRDVARLALDTSGGPSWKPLPVVATTVFSLAGSAAPALWLVVARAGGLLALAGAAALAGRLAGGLAAVAATLALALSDWWLFNTALGNSEGLLAAAVLWAVYAHLAGRHRVALALAVAVALLRPEAWPFLGLYAVWLWRTRREPVWFLALALLPVPLLWFGPDVLGAGGALAGSSAARGTGSPQSAVNADVPALEVLVDFTLLLTPVALVAAAVALAGRRPVAWVLAGGALAWVLLVAVMTQAGYAGNPRYNVAAAAVGCVLAGMGVAAIGRRHAVAGWLAAGALVAGVLVFTADDLADQAGQLGDRAERRTELDALVRRAGGARAVRACAPARTVQPMKAMLSWRLDEPMEHMADPPRSPAAVFRTSPGYEDEPAEPAIPPGFAPVASAGAWRLAAACFGGRPLRPSAARTGP